RDQPACWRCATLLWFSPLWRNECSLWYLLARASSRCGRAVICIICGTRREVHSSANAVGNNRLLCDHGRTAGPNRLNAWTICVSKHDAGRARRGHGETMSRDWLLELSRIVERESHEGDLLLQNPYDNPICKLSYDRELGCIEVVWRKYATSAQLRYVHE